MYWIVFQRQKIQGMLHYPGGPSIPSGAPDYQVVIVPAIFKCDSAEQACRAAARKTGGMGTYLAVEGTPWGVDLLADDGVEEVGAELYRARTPKSGAYASLSAPSSNATSR